MGESHAASLEAHVGAEIERLSDALPVKHANWKPIKWKLHDLGGKYHLQRMGAKAPVPGTQTIHEEERLAYQNQRQKDMADALASIENRHLSYARVKTRAAKAKDRSTVQATIGDALSRVHRVVESFADIDDGKNKDSFDLADVCSEEDLRSYFKYVAAQDDFNVNRMLRTGFMGINAQEKNHNDSGLHIAVRQGDLAMVKLLLRYNANPNLRNEYQDTPIHKVPAKQSCIGVALKSFCCDAKAWFFWSPTHYNDRKSLDL